MDSNRIRFILKNGNLYKFNSIIGKIIAYKF